MALFILSYLGGVLTILSPCILPVLPFVFARADQPFVRSGLPLLLGMAVTFAGVATLAVVSGDWAVHTNQYGRIAAIVLLAMFGITLLFPAVADRVTRPLVTAGAWLSERAHSNGHSGSPVFPLRERLSEELPNVRFSFEPNDIVSQVMSFGAPTPNDGRAARRH